MSQAERSRRYRERQKVAKYGPEAAGKDMRGHHGNHARAERNPRWNQGRLRNSEGYVLVRVEPSHPRAFGPPRLRNFKYAYEHDIVMEAVLGRHLRPGEIVHHRNGVRNDNRRENLELETRSGHSREHTNVPGARDELGRFAPGPRLRDPSEWPADLCVREFPAVAR